MKAEHSQNRYFLLMLISINIAGCQSNRTQTKKSPQVDTVKSSKNALAEKSISSSNCDSTIVNNEFSDDALAFKVFKSDTAKLKSLFLGPVVLKMEKQISDEGQSYYLYDFTDGINKIVLFRNSNEKSFYIEDADIRNDKVQLNKKIAIGMEEDVFLKLLKVKSIRCDTITVKNDELTGESVYIFKDAKLKQLKMGDILE